MLDRSAAQMRNRIPGAAAGGQAPGGDGRRRRALAALAILALALHAAFLDGVGDRGHDAPARAAPSMAVRAIAADPGPSKMEGDARSRVEDDVPSRMDDAVAVPPPPPPPAAEAMAPRRPGRAARPSLERAPTLIEASTGSLGAQVAPAGPVDTSLSAGDRPAAGPAKGEANGANAAAPTVPGVGDVPPPLYIPRLPPAATLHYQVQRGSLRGDGEIRWQPEGDRYRLVLEARIAGVALLLQTSEGRIDANGLAPERFLDQRARRSAQAANFIRDGGKITFSGSAVALPLVAGSQDRLSWMIQLAGIAAARPELLAEGGSVSMAVVGARGDASVWTLHYAGRERIATVRGSVLAVKLVREGRSAYDTSAEIWLDPERSYLPVHATLRNNGGAPEIDLLLERIDP